MEDDKKIVLIVRGSLDNINNLKQEASRRNKEKNCFDIVYTTELKDKTFESSFLDLIISGNKEVEND